MTITTWDNDGFKWTVTVPLGAGYPATTLVGKTLTAFIGVVNAAGVVSGAVAALTVTSTETATLATITALWTPAAVIYGKKRAQVIVTVPGDKPYTIADQDVEVKASLG